MWRRWKVWLLIVPVLIGAGWMLMLRAGAEETMGTDTHCKKLTPEEERVIVGRGTERAFTGAYWDHHEDGTYRCKRCGASLFPSSAKFDSGTGWPSFDNTVPGAVREVPDADGMRTEIVCAACGAHLGHVFRGEGFTDKGVRHCVNSISLDFAPAEAAGAIRSTQEAFFAGGCFWGVEYWFEKAPGVTLAESGYMGGHVDSPSYKEVCSGDTGHIETVHVVFDPSKTSYEALARLFFEIHDPTQVDRQGPDIGEQYRSVVFYANDEQRRVVEKLIGELRNRGYDVATRLEPAAKFWKAEAYHQDYYNHKGTTPYCHTPTQRFAKKEKGSELQ
jgi:peptide methionine sulfoxide reductase msrA/msrB